MKPTIEVGDKVRVDFNNSQFTLCHEAVVRAKPQATGDSWQFYSEKSGQLYYVSEGCTITKLADGDQNVPF